MKYLITGGSGFLGKNICAHFKEKNIDFTSTVRIIKKKNDFETGDLTQFNSWQKLFNHIDIIIHCAAKAHDMSNSPDLARIYTEINYELTLKIAENAKKYGVKRFVFISTIKVNGEFTNNRPFTADDKPNPTDEYSKSKYLAEQGLLKLHEPNVFEVVIIRPCLIYGPEVKANFNSLINIVKKRLPLPFASIKNRRSFISVENLIDLIVVASVHPNASGQIFLASDDEDMSLPQLIQKVANVLNLNPLLFPVPSFLLKTLLFIMGKRDLAQRLINNLQVDIEKTKTILNWKPVIPMTETLKKMT